MKTNKLHIVAFDVPYPPNYGAVIDQFYKIKELYELGILIYLHVYEFGRGYQEELEKYCEKVYYYSQSNSISSFLSFTPFIVQSRSSSNLIKNLKAIKAPILFEGLHTTFPLIKNSFQDQQILVRTHNIEHYYFKGLAKSESNIFKKLFYWIESLKLKNYESILKKADKILTISPFEQSYFKKIYKEKAIYIPVFHQNIKVKNATNTADKILYHGDLRISDNIKVARFLINTFKNFKHNLIIASSFENQSIKKEINKYSNIEFQKISSANCLETLFDETHINILLTYQKTGIKLKLINSLYRGRFIIANSEMIEDTGLENLCELVTTESELKSKVLELINTEFTLEIIQKREHELLKFDTKNNALKIVELLY